MADEIKETPSDDKFQAFLRDTKERFDTYFADLGYVCFMFNKNDHKGESVFVSNAPEQVLNIVTPFANAPKLAEAKIKGSKLKKLRNKLKRVK